MRATSKPIRHARQSALRDTPDHTPRRPETCLEGPLGEVDSEHTRQGQRTIVESVEQLATVNISRTGKNTRHSTLSQFHDEMATFSNLVLVIPECAGNFIGKRKPSSDTLRSRGETRGRAGRHVRSGRKGTTQNTLLPSHSSRCVKLTQFTRPSKQHMSRTRKQNLAVRASKSHDSHPPSSHCGGGRVFGPSGPLASNPMLRPRKGLSNHGRRFETGFLRCHWLFRGYAVGDCILRCSEVMSLMHPYLCRTEQFASRELKCRDRPVEGAFSHVQANVGIEHRGTRINAVILTDCKQETC